MQGSMLVILMNSGRVLELGEAMRAATRAAHWLIQNHTIWGRTWEWR